MFHVSTYRRPPLLGLWLLTSSAPTAHRAITRVLIVASNVPHARIVQTRLAKLPPVHVLDAPEAARGYGRSVRAGRHVHWCGRAVGHCGCCEWAEKLGQEGHGEVREDEEEDCL